MKNSFNKICPMLSKRSTLPEDVKHKYKELTYCLKGYCAWWYNGSCAIFAIPEQILIVRP